MDVSKRLVEQTADYNILETEFNGFSQQLRMWNTGVTEMKFSDDFAKANGYLDREDLLDKIEGMREYLNQVFGKIPEWITIDSERGFIGFPLLNTQTKASSN